MTRIAQRLRTAELDEPDAPYDAFDSYEDYEGAQRQRKELVQAISQYLDDVNTALRKACTFWGSVQHAVDLWRKGAWSTEEVDDELADLAEKIQQEVDYVNDELSAGWPSTTVQAVKALEPMFEISVSWEQKRGRQGKTLRVPSFMLRLGPDTMPLDTLVDASTFNSVVDRYDAYMWDEVRQDRSMLGQRGFRARYALLCTATDLPADDDEEGWKKLYWERYFAGEPVTDENMVLGMPKYFNKAFYEKQGEARTAALSLKREFEGFCEKLATLVESIKDAAAKPRTAQQQLERYVDKAQALCAAWNTQFQSVADEYREVASWDMFTPVVSLDVSYEEGDDGLQVPTLALSLFGESPVQLREADYLTDNYGYHFASFHDMLVDNMVSPMETLTGEEEE